MPGCAAAVSSCSRSRRAICSRSTSAIARSRGSRCRAARSRQRPSSIDRVRNDAGYAAGNLAVISSPRQPWPRARTALPMRCACVAQLEDRPLLEIGGLGASRLAPHRDPVQLRRADAACRRLHACRCVVLPPRRLHLLNPVQALQAVISGQLLRPGWARAAGASRRCCTGRPQRRAYQAFFHRAAAARARGGAAASSARRATHARYPAPALGDRGCAGAIRWCCGAGPNSRRLLDAADLRAAARADRGTASSALLRTAAISDAQATEGWNLESRGYVPHAVLMPPMPPPPAGEPRARPACRCDRSLPRSAADDQRLCSTSQRTSASAAAGRSCMSAASRSAADRLRYRKSAAFAGSPATNSCEISSPKLG